MVKLLVPLILSGVTFFVSCLFIGFCSSVLSTMLNLDKFIKPGGGQGNDFERVVPALRF